MSRVKVIAVASGKGGVGKTNVSVNLAYQLSRAGRKVLLLDADLGLANVDILLNLKPKRNLSDVLEGHCSLKDILITEPGGFKVIPAASGKKSMAEMAQSQHAGIVMAMSELDEDFDVMIVDTAAGISDSVVTFSQASQGQDNDFIVWLNSRIVIVSHITCCVDRRKSQNLDIQLSVDAPNDEPST